MLKPRSYLVRLVAPAAVATALALSACTPTTAPTPPPTTTTKPVTTTTRPTTTTTKPVSTTTTRPTTTTTKPTTTTTRPTPTTAPSPSGGSGTTSQYPSPATSGWRRTGVALSPYTGPGRITTAGTVIDGKDITTCLEIAAPNVTIRRSRVLCAGSYGISQTDYSGANSGLLVEDTEITSASTSARIDRAVATANGATLRRLYVHGTQRGISVGSNTVVEYSYVGDNVNPTDAHATAIMTSGGTKNVIVRSNTLKARDNASAAMAFYPENWAGGPNDNFLIDGNVLATDGGYCTYLGHGEGAPWFEKPNTNFRFVNNRFSTEYAPNCGTYGPVANWDTVGNTWSNNTWLGGPNDGRPVVP